MNTKGIYDFRQMTDDLITIVNHLSSIINTQLPSTNKRVILKKNLSSSGFYIQSPIGFGDALKGEIFFKKFFDGA
jgi:hypothetical protein